MKIKTIFLISALTLVLPATSFAQNQIRPGPGPGPGRPGERIPGGSGPDEGRFRQLERAVANLQYRVDELERGGVRDPRDRNRLIGYYCIAQCQNASYTQAGGRGVSQSEAKMAAFEAVRKSWNCSMEVVECSEEYGK